jgi:hypothetical protein
MDAKIVLEMKERPVYSVYLSRNGRIADHKHGMAQGRPSRQRDALKSSA